MKLINGLLRVLRKPALVKNGTKHSFSADDESVKTLRSRSRDSEADGYPHLGYEDETNARNALRRVDAYTMCSYERMITLWQQVRFLDASQVSGALVECGTWRGGAAGMMGLAHLSSGTPFRKLHLFDSFAGLPEPDAEHDGTRSVTYASGKATGKLVSIGKCVSPLDVATELLRDTVAYPEKLTHFHVGWFQESIPEVAEQLGPIALLRLDGDWYESTKICLSWLFPKVVPGGIVVIDDYGHWQGCRKAVDEYLAKLAPQPFLHHIDSTARYLVIQ